MADIRPKDFANTATSPADDDFLLLDGATAGTRKILGSRFSLEPAESWTELWTRTSPGAGEWDAYTTGSPAANLSPWGMGDAGAGTLTATLQQEATSGERRHLVEWSNLAVGSNLPKGAPNLTIGWHDYYESDPNPFKTGSTRGIESSTIESLKASVRWSTADHPVGLFYAGAIQSYLYFTSYTGDAFGGQTGIDLQIIGPWAQFPAWSDFNNRVATEVAFGPYIFDVYRSATTNMGGSNHSYSFLPARTAREMSVAPPYYEYVDLDFLAVVNWVRTTHNSFATRSDTSYFFRTLQAWVEPLSGSGQVDITGLSIDMDLV